MGQLLDSVHKLTAVQKNYGKRLKALADMVAGKVPPTRSVLVHALRTLAVQVCSSAELIDREIGDFGRAMPQVAEFLENLERVFTEQLGADPDSGVDLNNLPDFDVGEDGGKH